LVEHVVHLPPELDPLGAANREVLEEGDIRVDDLRQPVEAARRVAIVAASRETAERGDVEVAARIPRRRIAVVAARADDLAADPRTRSRVPSGEVEIVRRRRARSGPVAADDRRVARQLPTIE